MAPGASPALREEYARRAAAAAAYREAAGITDPEQAVALLPHRSSPELEDMRLAAIRALEIRDETEIIRGMTHGELEARTLEAERAQASAPPDVSRQLRLTAQAEADAWQQSADAATRHDHTQAANAKTLAESARRRTPAARGRKRPLRAMVRRHHQHQGNSRQSPSRTQAPRPRPETGRTVAASGA